MLLSVDSTLLAAQRTAALRRDDDLQATLLPLLLRNYISHKLYDQADRLISKAAFPDATAGNAQLARWHYYLGRVRAIQLNYTEAHNNLQQAIRRAPAPTIAPGFLQTVRSRRTTADEDGLLSHAAHLRRRTSSRSLSSCSWVRSPSVARSGNPFSKLRLRRTLRLSKVRCCAARQPRPHRRCRTDRPVQLSALAT